MNNSKCVVLNPPVGQPDQKSYADFNDNWPMNSWEVTENSCGYQASYIRLLSKFVEFNSVTSVSQNKIELNSLDIFPNPSTNQIKVSFKGKDISNFTILDMLGKELISAETKSGTINIQSLSPGQYILKSEVEGNYLIGKFLKN